MGIAAFTHPVSGIHYVYAEEVLYGKSIRYRIDNLETIGRDQSVFSWIAEPFHVTNTLDDGDGSLRRALENANANPGADVITFDIPGSEVHTIELLTPLPAITDAVTIDGTTEPDYAGSPVVEVLGTQLTVAAHGFEVHASNTSIRGLSIGGFSASGVNDAFIDGGTLIEGNYLGLRADGTTGAANGVGVGISGSPSAGFITRATVRDNVISGNSGPGVSLVGAAGVVLEGNTIGADASGTTALPNDVGVVLSNSSDNVIGGATPEQGNLISGNGQDGVRIEGLPSTGNRVQGNWIGTTAAGDAALPNAGRGVSLRNGASSNLIGVESLAGEGNVIAGNGVSGVEISGSAFDNQVAGNLIGTDQTGVSAVPNGTFGVLISSASNMIGVDGDGAADDLEGNVISGNAGAALRITGVAAVGNAVAGNLIGTQIDGDTPLANARSVEILFGADQTRIGTDGDGVSDELEGNVIAGNLRGVDLSVATNTTLAGNLIGVGALGAPLGNGSGGFGSGILIHNNTTDTRIGTNGDGLSDAAEANVIAYNSIGVTIVGAGDVRNSVRGNSIHSNVGGGIDLGEDGVTPNDPLDTDLGPNELQNYPILDTAYFGASTFVKGSLHAAPNSDFVIDLYGNEMVEPSYYGEGKRH
ncbi:MAG: right-handed parallel beta-helix repeat-containing protein, partial [Planctomycetales bacterium]|nr:right-handed parallel beta-helix repeat-containing protein [Planctomycetales bacterium]